MEIKNPEFDDIRPYYDDEVPAAINRLVEDPEFKRVVQFIFPDGNWEKFKARMQAFKTKYDFQHQMSKVEVYELVKKTSDSIDSAGFENVEKGKAYTYISNHRDIILDASLLCSILGNKGHDTTEIAIGDNLLLHPWIEDIVRLNKSFIVKRGVSIRQIWEVSKHLSRYIHFAVQEKNESVWIAQREGRAKDSNDRTQESLLKMLVMGSDKDFLGSIEELNITPVSFSYEYDPCDYLKAKEFQQRRDNPDFKKSQRDDLINMETGLFGYKGIVHLQIGNPINPQLSNWDHTLGKNELTTKIAELIDKEIFLNYRFYPCNYIAYDRLWGGNSLVENYTKEDIQLFDAYLQKQLQKIDLPDKDLPFLEEKILKMYAYPVKNQLSVK
jgi:1-acyl-sn-glycerol-3-phosphate acyltransferase